MCGDKHKCVYRGEFDQHSLLAYLWTSFKFDILIIIQRVISIMGRRSVVYLWRVNVALDLYSSFICLILFLHFFVSKRKKNKLRLCFAFICLFNFTMGMSDITSWVCQGFDKAWYPLALRGGTVLYFLCSGPLLLAFARYIIEFLAPHTKVRREFWIAASVLCGVQMLCSILTFWNGMYFTASAANEYVRGSWFWLSQLVPFILFVLDFAMLFCYRRHLAHSDLFWLSSYAVLPLICVAIQIANYGIALMNTGVTAAILLIFINIQSDQELRLEQQEKRLVESQIDIMLSQIQPHFLYNALTTIRQLCDEDPKLAKDCIRDFAYFLRANMDSLGSRVPIPFERELRHVEHFLKLEQQRFLGRLFVEYDIKTLDFSIPPLTLQPIVENAVRHGLLMRDRGGTISISALETEDSYVITVQDDGVGFSEGELPVTNTERSHMGIQNVRDRLLAMCLGTLHITSRLNVGTTAIIAIPKEDRTG